METYYKGQTLYGFKKDRVVLVKLKAIDSKSITIESNGREYQFDPGILGRSLFANRHELYKHRLPNKSTSNSSATAIRDQFKPRDYEDLDKKLQNMRENPSYDSSQHKRHTGSGQLLSENQMTNWPEEMGFRRPFKRR